MCLAEIFHIIRVTFVEDHIETVDRYNQRRLGFQEFGTRKEVGAVHGNDGFQIDLRDATVVVKFPSVSRYYVVVDEKWVLEHYWL